MSISTATSTRSTPVSSTSTEPLGTPQASSTLVQSTKAQPHTQDTFEAGTTNAKAPRTPPDESAAAAIKELNQISGKINADTLTKAIEKGIGDADEHSAGPEFGMFKAWAHHHKDELTPGAKKVMAIYTKYASEARSHNNPSVDYGAMMAEMKAVQH